MSLVKLPDIRGLQDKEIYLNVMNGIPVDKVFKHNLCDLDIINDRNRPLLSGYASIVTYFINIGDFRQVRHIGTGDVVTFGFMLQKGKMNVCKTTKHDRPVLFN